MTMPAKGFFKQQLGKIPLKIGYWPEAGALNLGIKDKEGNTITLYRGDYINLIKKLEEEKGLKLEEDPKHPGRKESYNVAVKRYVEENALDFEGFKDLVKELNAKRGPKEYDMQLIKYLSKESLSERQIQAGSNFAPDGGPTDVAGRPLEKGKHQNCVVMLGKDIYIHPKVRANIGKDILGVNHSSLAGRQMVSFAGSFVHDAQHGWVIENTTGHYGTRFTQMRNFLEQLESKTNIEDLTVKFYILNPGAKGEKEEDYTIIYKKAADFLKQSEKSFKAMADKIAKKEGRVSAESVESVESVESDREKGPLSGDASDEEPQGPLP